MKLIRLDIDDIRSLRGVRLQPGPGINLFVGRNGAGKTSVLEAIHLLAYGRSFRGRVRDGLITTGRDAVQVFAGWEEAKGDRFRQVGLRHAGSSWAGRLDGSDVDQLSTLCSALAVVTFEPGSHGLLEGGGEPRRRLLDWGLFHVEPAFLEIWRRYGRALRQRNALLKAGAQSSLDAWDNELAAAGELLDRFRRDYQARLQVQLHGWLPRLLPDMGEPILEYRSGWRRDHGSLLDALLLARERDLALGYSTSGPHRGDLRLGVAGRPGGEALSRGQAKLATLSLLLAQAEDFRMHRGEWPVVLLDDLAAELDPQHRTGLVHALVESGAQLFITATDLRGLDLPAAAETAMFHVEQGEVRPA